MSDLCVRSRQGIQVQSTGILPAQEVGPDFKFWVSVVNTEVLDPRRKTLVQPQVGPPLHSDLCMCMTARNIMQGAAILTSNAVHTALTAL